MLQIRYGIENWCVQGEKSKFIDCHWQLTDRHWNERVKSFPFTSLTRLWISVFACVPNLLIVLKLKHQSLSRNFHKCLHPLVLPSSTTVSIRVLTKWTHLSSTRKREKNHDATVSAQGIPWGRIFHGVRHNSLYLHEETKNHHDDHNQSNQYHSTTKTRCICGALLVKRDYEIVQHQKICRLDCTWKLSLFLPVSVDAVDSVFLWKVQRNFHELAVHQIVMFYCFRFNTAIPFSPLLQILPFHLQWSESNDQTSWTWTRCERDCYFGMPWTATRRYKSYNAPLRSWWMSKELCRGKEVEWTSKESLSEI